MLRDGVLRLKSSVPPDVVINLVPNPTQELALQLYAASAGSEGNGDTLSADDLIAGLKSMGMEASFNRNQAVRLISGFSKRGDGGLTVDELSHALRHRALHIINESPSTFVPVGYAGSMHLDESVQPPGYWANVALRMSGEAGAYTFKIY